MAVAVVTDSTAYLPQDLVDELGIRVVPVQVVLDGVAHNESGGISTADLVAALRAGAVATTSRPSPGQFERVYRQAESDGADSIVSIHLSGGLSGTCESAAIAAARMSIPVTAVDSRQVAMALGFAVVAAAKAARNGATLDSIVAGVHRDCADSHITFLVETLEFLERGGRISAMRAKLGSALQVKPVLEMLQGEVSSRELVRTSSRGLARLADIAAEQHRPGRPVAVHHVADSGRAAQLASTLTQRLGLPEVSVTECGAVIAAHVGPGALAVVIGPQPS
jgi:DegV family protein with EDD domain